MWQLCLKLHRFDRVSTVTRPFLACAPADDQMSPSTIVSPHSQAIDRWVVHKFGGSSVADAGCFERVANILESQPQQRLGVVLSACRGVTDALLRLVALAEQQDERYQVEVQALRERHATIARALLSGQAAALFQSAMDRDCHDIEGILHTVQLTRSAADNVRDLIAGYGEIWSTRLFHKYFESRTKRPGKTVWVDARRVVVVEWSSLGPAVQWSESQENMDRLVGADFQGTLIITGFIACQSQGRADHPRSQWERLLRLDLRRAARRGRNPDLDRRGWRAVRGSAARAGRQGHRFLVL